MPTLVEIGPSNASQGQHRRKEATKYINITIYIYIYIYIRRTCIGTHIYTVFLITVDMCMFGLVMALLMVFLKVH